jgi:hypothetical protein
MTGGRRGGSSSSDGGSRRAFRDGEYGEGAAVPRAWSAAALVALVCVGSAGARTHAVQLPPLPAGWPRTLQLGLTDGPGGAAALRTAASFGFRYQYLAGGVNTRQGWSTWNPNGTFASMYVDDSWSHGEIPVLTYYMLLQSKPGGGGGEAEADLTNLRDPATMAAYWNDVRLLFTRVKGSKPVVVHVEPDLWGYLEQANAVALASAFAQQWIKLRNQLAPNVVLAYHMSGWGTKHDIVYEKPPDATVRAYAAQSAEFYRSLHAHFDIAFEDFSDRDVAFYAKVEHNPKTWFKPADFHRHLLYAQTFVRLAGVRMVAWQIPLGNTLMRAENNTWGHYQDNRVQWLLGDGSRARLKQYVAAGFAGFLFGGGATGTTCACDADKDGVTNPPPIDGNTRQSLSADDDGGYFKAQARSYYKAGAIPLPQ